MFETIEKRDVFHDGVWCIADIGTTEYNAKKAISQATVEWGNQALYGHYIVYLFTVIIFIFIIKRILYILTDNSSKIINSDSNFVKNWYYKICAINRWICYRRFPSFICEIFQLPSSMGNFLLIMAGCLYILCYSFIPKFWYRECRGFGSPPLAVRAGLQSTALVPFIFILSGKTNLISQLTDISYEKLNVYHRWISGMCCFLGWLHTIPFYIQAVREGGIKRLEYFQRTEELFVNGIPPLVFLTVLTIFSHSYIRMIWYELWLQIHWICALGFYISLFIHVYPEMDAWKYMVATIVFWITQLSWRALTKAMLRPNKGFLRSNTCKMKRFISNNENEHYFEILIENSNDFSWVPGQHLFLRIPGLRFIENHPFSISSYFEPKENTNIKLIIKAIGFGGMTDQIYKKLPDIGYTDSTVFIDGPYGGCSRPIDAFDSIFLLASGTGISAILPFLHDSCKKIKYSNGIIKRVNFDWIVRSSDNIEWIIPELKNIVQNYNELIKDGHINVNIHVKEDIGMNGGNTIEMLDNEINSPLSSPSPSPSPSSDSESDNKEEINPLELKDNKVNTFNMVNIINSKPSIKELIKDISPILLERNIFIVSGSDSMKVQVSNSVASLQTEVLKKGSGVREIYLHSESFGW